MQSFGAMRKLLVLSTVIGIAAPVQAQLVPIEPKELSIPPYSYLLPSVKRLAGGDVAPNRYITYLGTWENNGEANWERSAWWGRFYVDCLEKTFKVTHFKHRHIGRSWRDASRNVTALYGLEKLCPKRVDFPVETRTISDLNDQFDKQFHNSSHTFDENPVY